jgi:hypothetical protein
MALAAADLLAPVEASGLSAHAGRLHRLAFHVPGTRLRIAAEPLPQPSPHRPVHPLPDPVDVPNSEGFSRKLDAVGYATFMRWKLYGAEAVAALWLQERILMLEHAGETLSRYEVERIPGSDKLRDVGKPALFEANRRRSLSQARTFGLEEVLGDGWLKALKLREYAPRRPHRPQALQEVLFPYAEAL